MWKAPERSEWNGEIQGYYVGYKQSSLVDNKFVFETVEFSKEEGKEHYLEILNLKYTKNYIYYIMEIIDWKIMFNNSNMIFFINVGKVIVFSVFILLQTLI